MRVFAVALLAAVFILVPGSMVFAAAYGLGKYFLTRQPKPVKV
jgi:uncharacterized membrane protein YjjB (DUF3815 family)